MRKNKRRKKRLKTALILLIILFILAGFGGMLFVSHKNKIEKEQRKEAALAALDSTRLQNELVKYFHIPSSDFQNGRTYGGH